MIAIIDYGAGNVKSVENAVHYLGQDTVCTCNPNEIVNASHVIFPGVGSYGSAMKSLNSSGLIPVIREVIENRIPFLGICLGYQLLFDGSEEEGGVEGLHIFPGDVIRFPDDNALTIPHIGWNTLNILNEKGIFSNIDKEPFVYFVHSYYVQSENRDIVSSRTNYIVDYDSSIQHENVCGCQFHPEKSSSTGLMILKNFMEQ